MENVSTPLSSNLKQPGLGVVFVLLLVGVMIGFQLGRWSNSYDLKKLVSPTPISCTLEAKECPDGSTVGRVPPNCEFAECPILIPSPQPSIYSPERDCVSAGCSGQLCVPASEFDTPSTCEMKDEYGCLQYSSCEVQQNGECGWTQTPEYSGCLDNLKR